MEFNVGDLVQVTTSSDEMQEILVPYEIAESLVGRVVKVRDKDDSSVWIEDPKDPENDFDGYCLVIYMVEKCPSQH